jgi:hypothetical protein
MVFSSAADNSLKSLIYFLHNICDTRFTGVQMQLFIAPTTKTLPVARTRNSRGTTAQRPREDRA